MNGKPNTFLINRLVTSIRTIHRPITGYVHPVTGKKPPTIEEFDPLNPGEWQVGAAGKILPRLPEGTRCGGLVMGKYGLYSPSVRALQEECFPKHEAGVSTDVITEKHRLAFKALVVILVLSYFFAAHNLAMMLYGTKEKPLWPYTLFMKKTDE